MYWPVMCWFRYWKFNSHCTAPTPINYLATNNESLNSGHVLCAMLKCKYFRREGPFNLLCYKCVWSWRCQILFLRGKGVAVEYRQGSLGALVSCVQGKVRMSWGHFCPRGLIMIWVVSMLGCVYGGWGAGKGRPASRPLKNRTGQRAKKKRSKTAPG